MKTLNAASVSQTTELADAIVQYIRRDGRVQLNASGAEVVYRMIKATIVAKQNLERDDIFIHFTLDCAELEEEQELREFNLTLFSYQ